ncbi:OmpP1/FadL family transporter [Desulfobotulus sp.]|uniref:OmpP1/FadL family transporter n=1 Tax=Desulfobotulus sp. TaxID=1940337 RepID=UPI002A35F8A8|nr:outer membrane protein transport protein [Desulfobotulus sp.]MDY0161851.1 outer membrane protein transport protein [Desulfobotulus sp.]
MTKRLILFTTTLLLAASTAYAGCVDTFGIGARATSMGGAFSAYADDPFAAYYNPAGLTQIQRPTLAVGVHVIDPDLEVKGLRIEGSNDPRFKDKTFTVQDDFPILAAPHLGFAMPLSERIGLGFAVYAPWGLEVEWPKNKDTNPAVHDSYHSYYKRIAMTPTIAYKLNDRLSIGLGVSIGRSEAGGEKIPYYFSAAGKTGATAYVAAVQGGINPETGAPLNPATDQAVMQKAQSLGSALYMDGQHLEMEVSDDLNYSFNLGVMYRPTESITLGLTYRSETKAEFEGDLKRNGVKIAKAKMDYNHPQQVQAGIRYAPHSRFSMEFDLVWTEWSINQRQVEDFYLYAGGVSQSAYERKWENTRQIRFGAEYLLNDVVSLRCGYFYDPSPIPDDTLDLMWPDADKKTYALGAGFHFGNFTLDTVIQYTAVEQDRIVGGESNNFNKSFKDVADPTSNPRVSAKAGGHLLGAGLTLTYRF